MITILLEKILAALTQLLSNIKTKLNTIKNNLDDLIVVATATGPIASFTTTITKPFISFIVDIPESETGTDTITVYQTGSNIWNEKWELGSISTANGSLVVSTTTIRSKNKIKVAAGSKYSLVKPSGQQIFILFYDKNDTPIQYVQVPGDSLVVFNISANISQLSTNGTFTVPSGTDYILFRYDGTTTYESGVSINYPSTDTEYHAHVTEATKTVTLPETVYGGEVDITDLITPEIKVINGVNNIFTDSGDVTVEYLKII